MGGENDAHWLTTRAEFNALFFTHQSSDPTDDSIFGSFYLREKLQACNDGDLYFFTIDV